MQGQKSCLRKWIPEDSLEIMKMEKAISKETEGWEVESSPLICFQKLLTPDKGAYIVSLDPSNQKLSGMINYVLSDKNRGWVQSLYIHPDFRGKGIFRAFFKKVVEELKQLGSSSLRLEVECDNLKAKAAYQHIGLKCSGEVSFVVDFYYGESLSKNEILSMKFPEFQLKKLSEIRTETLSQLKPIMKRESNFSSGYALVQNEQIIAYFDYEMHLSSWRGSNSATILNLYARDSFNQAHVFFIFKSIIRQCDPGQIFFFLLDKNDTMIVDLFPKGRMKKYDTMKLDL